MTELNTIAYVIGFITNDGECDVLNNNVDCRRRFGLRPEISRWTAKVVVMSDKDLQWSRFFPSIFATGRQLQPAAHCIHVPIHFVRRLSMIPFCDVHVCRQNSKRNCVNSV